MPEPEPFRLEPAMPAQDYVSYQIVAPVSTHFRPATCEETQCADYLNGWRIRKELLDARMLYTATHAGRAYTEMSIAEGETYLVYQAGQACFKASTHRVRLDRPEFFYRRPGDWRGNPTDERPYLHQRPENWVEDFSEHQDKISTAINQG